MLGPVNRGNLALSINYARWIEYSLRRLAAALIAVAASEPGRFEPLRRECPPGDSARGA
jgi:hypothetical protein